MQGEQFNAICEDCAHVPNYQPSNELKVGSPEVSKTLNFFLHWRGMRCDVKFEFV